MMKLNLVARGHDLSHVQNVDDLAKKASQQNISTLQLALSRSFPTLAADGQAINAGMGQYMKNILAKEGISVGILSCYINMIHPDLSVRETVLRQFERYLQYAASFGATMVATETGSVSEAGYTEDNFSDEAFLQIVEAIHRLVRAGEKHRTRLESSVVFIRSCGRVSFQDRFGLSRHHFRPNQSDHCKKLSSTSKFSRRSL